MNDVIATLVVNFGKDASSASGSIKAEWDDEMTLDAQGKSKTRFVPGDERYLRVHTDPTATIVAAKSTSGSIVSVGETVLTLTDLIGWSWAGDEQSLQYLPAGSLSFDWFGNKGSDQDVSGKAVRFSGGQFPCLAKVSFPVRFTRYRLQTPVMALAKDESWPLRVYIYYLQEKTT